MASFYEPATDAVYLVPGFVALAAPGAVVRLSAEHQAAAWRPLPDARDVFRWATQRDDLDAIIAATRCWPRTGPELGAHGHRRAARALGATRPPARRRRRPLEKHATRETRERGPVPGLGIIGFERSGKTSLFNAVTGSEQAVGFATHQEPHVGVAKVPDARLERLSAMYRPKKTTPASLSYVDFPGGSFRGASGPGGDAGGPQVRFLDELSQQDALIHVVRAFDNDAVPHPRQRVDPARDIEDMLLELVFADMALIEKRLDRIAAETKALKAAERERADRDAALLRRLTTSSRGARRCAASPSATWSARSCATTAS